MQIMVMSTIFLYNLSLKGLQLVLYLNKRQFLLPKDPFCKIWLKQTQRSWRKKPIEMYFYYVTFISPWKKVWSLVEQTLILFTRRFSTQRLIGTDLMAMDVVLKVNIFLCAYRAAQCLFTIAFRVIEFLIIDDNMFIWHFIWRKVLTYC